MKWYEKLFFSTIAVLLVLSLAHPASAAQTADPLYDWITRLMYWWR